MTGLKHNPSTEIFNLFIFIDTIKFEHLTSTLRWLIFTIKSRYQWVSFLYRQIDPRSFIRWQEILSIEWNVLNLTYCPVVLRWVCKCMVMMGDHIIISCILMYAIITLGGWYCFTRRCIVVVDITFGIWYMIYLLANGCVYS